MTNAARNPNPSGLADPVGIDAALAMLGAHLTAALPWLERVLGRAFAHTKPGPDNRPVTEPCVWDAGTDYRSALPNDQVKAQVFFTVADPVTPTDDWLPGAAFNELKASVSAVFWVNLAALDPARSGPWQETLILQVRQALASAPGCRAGRHYQTPAEVLRGFTLPKSGERWLMLPYAGFRVEMELVYSPPCP